MANNAKNTTVTRTAIEVTKAPYVSQFQKTGTKTVELKQVVKTISEYQGAIINDGNADIFGDAFGGETKEYTQEEIRMCWYNVPANLTDEQVMEKMLPVLEKGCLQKVLSNHPILDRAQAYAVSQKPEYLDKIAESQAVRYGESHEKAGQLVLDPNDKIQYRRIYFKGETVEDIDKRGNGEEYASTSLLAELNGAAVYNNQTI